MWGEWNWKQGVRLLPCNGPDGGADRATDGCDDWDGEMGAGTVEGKKLWIGLYIRLLAA